MMKTIASVAALAFAGVQAKNLAGNGRRLEAHGSSWTDGYHLGCQMGVDPAVSENVSGRVGLYQPFANDYLWNGVQSMGGFYNLPEELGEDFYLQVVSADSGDVRHITHFEGRDTQTYSMRADFFNGAYNDDWFMCLEDNCEEDSYWYFPVKAGDVVQLKAYYDDEDRNLGECQLISH